MIVTGDSAGGYLTFTTTVLSIMLKKSIQEGIYSGTNNDDLINFKVPSSILMHYPALESDINKFSPSNLYFLDDPLLNTCLMKMVFLDYI